MAIGKESNWYSGAADTTAALADALFYHQPAGAGTSPAGVRNAAHAGTKRRLAALASDLPSPVPEAEAPLWDSRWPWTGILRGLYYAISDISFLLLARPGRPASIFIFHWHLVEQQTDRCVNQHKSRRLRRANQRVSPPRSHMSQLESSAPNHRQNPPPCRAAEY